jgi:hypothetical protein
MTSFRLIAPGPPHVSSPTNTGDSDLAAARLRADLAVATVKLLECAAGAAQRAGSWMPAGAVDDGDYRALCAVQDLVARHHRSASRTTDEQLERFSRVGVIIRRAPAAPGDGGS